jgi:hypothetical protein
VQQFRAETNILVITQQPHSPNLAPGDLPLFANLKMGLKGTRSATMEDIESKAITEFRMIPN